MLRAEFDAGMNTLMTIYEKRVKGDLADMIFERVKYHDRSDWMRGVRGLMEDPDRKMFPRLGEIMYSVSDAASYRREAEWNEQKHRERQEIDTIMQGPSGDTIRDQSKGKIRALILAIGEGRQEVEALAQDYADGADSVHACLCDNGLVFYSRPGPDSKPYQHVGSCSECEAGKNQSKAYPSVDPETMMVTIPKRKITRHQAKKQWRK